MPMSAHFTSGDIAESEELLDGEVVPPDRDGRGGAVLTARAPAGEIVMFVPSVDAVPPVTAYSGCWATSPSQSAPDRDQNPGAVLSPPPNTLLAVFVKVPATAPNAPSSPAMAFERKVNEHPYENPQPRDPSGGHACLR